MCTVVYHVSPEHTCHQLFVDKGGETVRTRFCSYPIEITHFLWAGSGETVRVCFCSYPMRLPTSCVCARPRDGEGMFLQPINESTYYHLRCVKKETVTKGGFFLRLSDGITYSLSVGKDRKMLRIRFRNYPIRTVGGKRPRNGEGMFLQLTGRRDSEKVGFFFPFFCGYPMRSRTLWVWARTERW